MKKKKQEKKQQLDLIQTALVNFKKNVKKNPTSITMSPEKYYDFADEISSMNKDDDDIYKITFEGEEIDVIIDFNIDSRDVLIIK